MTEITQIFTNRARASVLATLYPQSEPIPLREVASLSGLPVHSVERALNQLWGEKFVTRRKKDRYVQFALNRLHANYELLKQIFEIEAAWRLRRKSESFSKQARHALAFASQTREFLQKARAIT